jgi:hypothetical protein
MKIVLRLGFVPQRLFIVRSHVNTISNISKFKRSPKAIYILLKN